jgi:hypothetical protein
MCKAHIMLKRMSQAVVGAVATVLVAGPVAAQQIPVAETGASVVSFLRNGNKFRLADAESGFEVMPFGYDAYEAMGEGIAVQVDMNPQPSGVDIVYRLTNNGTQPARLGRLPFGKINLGDNITYQEVKHVGQNRAASFATTAAQAYMYPNELYSPVWVMRNANYAVSFSMQYPVLDYKHDVRIMMRSTPGDADPAIYGPRGWQLEFRCANFGDENAQSRITREAYVAAGESRTYVVSIRVTKTPSDWIRTLVPYRNYFKSMYGGVSYRRDDRPIRPLLMAVEHNIAPSNPSGWAGYANQRPDRYTFRPWLDWVKSEPKYSRVMFWAPTGLYDGPAAALNYPYQFASRWADEPSLASALDPQYGFPSIPAAGMTLGLWWGRALQVARTWNPDVMEDFDPTNRDHREMALREMDVAVQSGATEIGLDTFTTVHTPIWKLYPWLRTMRERYPTVKFCIEPVCCDIMHTQAAEFVAGWHELMPRDAAPDWSTIENPHYLADFLNPGHETWGAMSYHMQRAYNIPVTPTMVQAHTERIASYGYIPVMFDDVPDPREVHASTSWMTTVPHDLLPGSGWNVNFNNNMVVRGADGRMKILSDAAPGATPGNAPMGTNAPAPNPGTNPAGNPGDDDDAPPTDMYTEGMSNTADASVPTKTVVVRPSNGSKKPAKAVKGGGGSRTPARAPTGRGSARSRAGTGVSAAALARAGLLGKSVSSVSRAQVMEAIQRLNTPNGQ